MSDAFKDPEVHCRVHKNQPLDLVWSEMSSQRLLELLFLFRSGFKTRKLAVLTEMFRDIPLSLQESDEVVPEVYHDSFFSHILQIIVDKNHTIIRFYMISSVWKYVFNINKESIDYNKILRHVSKRIQAAYVVRRWVYEKEQTVRRHGNFVLLRTF